MPTVNIFYQQQEHADGLIKQIEDIKSFIARELTCGDIQLNPSEVSVRFITTLGTGMVAELEVEVTAHAFKERIDRQDDICLQIRKLFMNKIRDIDIRVWLLLPQLGHSWE